MKDITAVVLAAGKGTRMNSDLPKVLHPLLNRPMLEYVLEAAALAGAQKQIIVTGHGGDLVQKSLRLPTDAQTYRFVTQEPQLGTGHAMQVALPAVEDDCGCLLVLCGDTPLIRAATLRALLQHFKDSGTAAAVLTTKLAEPQGYGRIIRDTAGRLLRIVEEKDATVREKAITEINTGIYCFEPKALAKVLKNLRNDNAQGEYYLTDALAALISAGHSVCSYHYADARETSGVNDRVQLATATANLRQRINERHMLAGVTIVDPASTLIEPDVEIAAETVIEPQCHLRGRTKVGPHCHLGVGTEITDSTLAAGVQTLHAVIVEAEIGPHCTIGPFAYLRPGTKLAAQVKAGHFVELKKAEVGEGSKIPHLSYVGDALVGRGVNIGCGTITCNYDGEHKYTTVIEDNAFIGSNTNLVAPVTVGARATTGAGSTITKDVPADALALERAEQKQIAGYSKRPKKKR